MSKLTGACIIGQSGGPTSVINASAYGAMKAALEADCITKVYGAEHGIKGVLNDRLIVIDEEQEGAYASQQAPRYHAREIARLRCRRHGALLLMASATPSVETFYQAKRGKIHLFTLSRRYLGSQLPKVQIVDMKQSFGLASRSFQMQG